MKLQIAVEVKIDVAKVIASLTGFVVSIASIIYHL